ncbi:PTS sugar transporter subunit IIA [Glaciihabitans arcticus]|uniref:Ascorbate-specific PTS system EIIA component n=1 Tax=Glaciihabitans arcticus TaxID=2668039 RepID=A0A4Q9GQ55_9MICO|nr:PTS sugar transporter subunit IIA [Glaciihabitans arcticus]TBN56976.1 PTS sugar transporter subunit IIA [Glaciihabitans arcticus]
MPEAAETSNALDAALSESSISVAASAPDWRGAVTLAGDALVAGGVTTAAYTAEMIAAIDELGPYVVIAPGLALAHSRPSPAVLRAGLSWISLTEPVPFGHPSNDPVSLVIGLAAPDHDGHLEVMSALAGVLSDDAALARLKAASSPADLKTLLSQLSA